MRFVGSVVMAASLAACTLADPNYLGDATGNASSGVGQPSSTTTGAPSSATEAGTIVTDGMTATSTVSSGTQTGGSRGTTGESGCTSHEQCAGTPQTPACDPATGSCVGCTDNSPCDGPAPRCSLGLGECVECVTVADCPRPSVCIANACAPYHRACQASKDCATADGTECCTEPQCEDTCAVPCLYSSECPTGTECAHGYCLVPCQEDGECAEFDGFTCQHPAMRVNTLCEAD